jgi:hypothetical protein
MHSPSPSSSAVASSSPSSSDLSPADGFLCGNNNPIRSFSFCVLVPASVGNSVKHLADPRDSVQQWRRG